MTQGGPFLVATPWSHHAGKRHRDHLPQAELQTLESEGHNSVVRHLPEIINTLIATGQSAQN